MSRSREIKCLIGQSANRTVLVGFASADLLHRISFADVLNEDTGRGYQRRFNAKHSQDFRRYIRTLSSSTPPLTLNLRPSATDAWRVVELGDGTASLEIASDAEKIMAQVDCQHRLGHLEDVTISLPFMCFIGLSEQEEMEVFNIINGKAKGLSTSLLDFHDAQLALDLAGERPELFIALFLNNDDGSPWYRLLDLGGQSTSGLARRASLRTMQKAVKRFLNRTHVLKTTSSENAASLVLNFWSAIQSVLPDQWAAARKHMLTKGVGVYALMEVAADIVSEAPDPSQVNKKYFVNALSDFALDIDWSTAGPLKGLGGEGGVKIAVELLRDARRRSRLRLVNG